MEMWTVYDHPHDFPEHFVARLFVMSADTVGPTQLVLVANTLDELRDEFESHGLVCLTRHPSDDAKIVEVWL
jgi:hypothetical protein